LLNWGMCHWKVENILPTVILCLQHCAGIKKSRHFFNVNNNTLENNGASWKSTIYYSTTKFQCLTYNHTICWSIVTLCYSTKPFLACCIPYL
jgi:hypothetical protein